VVSQKEQFCDTHQATVLPTGQQSALAQKKDSRLTTIFDGVFPIFIPRMPCKSRAYAMQKMVKFEFKTIPM
jgi:hypothetical protein